jgi:peptide/nickel transport system permease protein
VLFYVVRRLAWTVVILAVISLITFVIFLAIPNTAARARVSWRRTCRRVNLKGHSLPYQYAHFLDRIVVHGDLGHSLRQPLTVRYMLGQALPVTLSLIIGGTILCLLIAFPIGLIAALRPRSFLSRGLMIFVLIGVSTHAVWLSLFFSYVFGSRLHWFPVAGHCDLHYHPGAAPAAGALLGLP